jgi:hypothetical protein
MDHKESNGRLTQQKNTKNESLQIFKVQVHAESVVMDLWIITAKNVVIRLNNQKKSTQMFIAKTAIDISKLSKDLTVKIVVKAFLKTHNRVKEVTHTNLNQVFPVNHHGNQPRSSFVHPAIRRIMENFRVSARIVKVISQ